MRFIVKLIYNLSIRSYVLLIRIASLFNAKAKKWITGRKDVFPFLSAHIPSGGAGVWIHCASLGEFEQGRPLIEALRKQNPDLFILLTFFSPSGYEVRKNYPHADLICYLPADTNYNARKFISIVRPKLAIFVKYEFWFHYISILQKQKIPILLVSGIFRKEQIFFKSFGKSFRKMLKGYSCLFIQDGRSASLLKDFEIHNFCIAGDTRMDRVKQLSLTARNFPEIEIFIDGKNCWIAGSTWPPDEQVLKKGIDKISKWIIAPHEITETHLQEIEKLFGPDTIRYSILKNEPEKGKPARVLILDNIGMLSSVYRLGTVAYIGGGFGKGIHNILEAAVHRIPVIFGPNYHKFEEAKALISREGAFAIRNEDDFQKVIKMLSRDQIREEAGAKAAEYIADNLGATAKIMDYIQEKRFLIRS